MAREHVPPGQIASVRPLGTGLGSARTTALLKSATSSTCAATSLMR